MTVFEDLQMPSLDGATEWLNSEPLGPAELRGHVVLVNFWTLTCINWLRTEPYIRTWSQAYRNDGLVVIGVHTPEFSFEHGIDRVRHAIREREIDYPVAVDNYYVVWSAFDNHYWPALYFIDAESIIRDHHFGEGRYEQSERIIQRLLGVQRELVSVEGRGVEAAADWNHLQTPETYLGYGRSERFTPADGATLEPRAYELPKQLQVNHWALAGDWTIGRENVVLDHAGGSIAFRFHARDGHLVLSGLYASMTGSTSERSRSPSTSPAPRRTHSPSGKALASRQGEASGYRPGVVSRTAFARDEYLGGQRPSPASRGKRASPAEEFGCATEGSSIETA